MAEKHTIDDSDSERFTKRQRSEATPPPASTTINIALRGDVILVLDNGSKKFRVLSDMMRMSSSTFDAMFDPERPWRESQELNKDQPNEVALPSDHGDAMEIICKMVH